MAEAKHLLVGVHREHDDADVGHVLFDLAGGLHAVHLGHGDVHQDDVGLEVLGQADGLLAVAGLADDVEALVGHRTVKTFTQHPVVVRQHQPDCRCANNVIVHVPCPF